MTTPSLVGSRAINRASPLSDIAVRRARARRDKRFVLRFDVHQCYPSIYTHSILWAIHSKATAKQSFSSNSHTAMLGHTLDTLLRNCQEKESIGIPIGPDTSLLAAEVVLTAIDLVLQQELGCEPDSGFRYMDEWELCFDTMDDAERAAALLESTLASFRLTINRSKSKIEQLPIGLTEYWLYPLRQFTVRSSSDAATVNDIADLFSLAYALREEADDSAPVLKYAIKKASRFVNTEAVFDRFLQLALGALVHEPHALPFVSRFLTYSIASGLAGSGLALSRALKAIEEAFCHLGTYHADRSHSFETTWILWTLARFMIPLSSRLLDAIQPSKDDLTVIMLLYCKQVGLTDPEIRPQLLDEIDSVQNLARSEHWLLAYECTRRGWEHQAEIADDEYFRQLLAHRVDFLRDPQMPTRQAAQHLLGLTTTPTRLHGQVTARIEPQVSYPVKAPRPSASGHEIPVRDEVEGDIEYFELPRI